MSISCIDSILVLGFFELDTSFIDTFPKIAFGHFLVWPKACEPEQNSRTGKLLGQIWIHKLLQILPKLYDWEMKWWIFSAGQIQIHTLLQIVAKLSDWATKIWIFIAGQGSSLCLSTLTFTSFQLTSNNFWQQTGQEKRGGLALKIEKTSHWCSKKRKIFLTGSRGGFALKIWN